MMGELIICTSSLEQFVCVISKTIVLWRSPYHIETSSIICPENKWCGFYMIETSIMKELIALCGSHFFLNKNISLVAPFCKCSRSKVFHRKLFWQFSGISQMYISCEELFYKKVTGLQHLLEIFRRNHFSKVLWTNAHVVVWDRYHWSTEA